MVLNVSLYPCIACCANFSELSGKQHLQSVVYSLGINVKCSLSEVKCLLNKKVLMSLAFLRLSIHCLFHRDIS